MSTPVAEIEIDEALVRALLETQCPALAVLPLRLVDAGWDNETWRLGEELVVRVPRRGVAAQLIRHEQDHVPAIRERVALPVPELVHRGEPARGYPWPWSVLSWLEGQPADLGYPDPSEAPVLSDFLKALHQPASPEAPENPHRGVPLRSKADKVEDWLSGLRHDTDLISPRIEDVWSEALAAPESRENVWLHGDLHARNVLVRDGKFSGIIDWGDVTSGDPASDLASLWMLFDDPAARRAAITAYGMDAELTARARGWAVFYGAILLHTGLADHPRHAEMGRKTLKNLDAEI